MTIVIVIQEASADESLHLNGNRIKTWQKKHISLRHFFFHFSIFSAISLSLLTPRSRLFHTCCNEGSRRSADQSVGLEWKWKLETGCGAYIRIKEATAKSEKRKTTTIQWQNIYKGREIAGRQAAAYCNSSSGQQRQAAARQKEEKGTKLDYWGKSQEIPKDQFQCNPAAQYEIA